MHEDVEYETFKATFVAQDLFESDDEWQQCLCKASAMESDAQLRCLFVTILIHGPPSIYDGK